MFSARHVLTILTVTAAVLTAGCSSETESTTTTTAPVVTTQDTSVDPAAAGGVGEPTGEPVSFCEPLGAVMDIFASSGGDQAEAEALVTSLGQLITDAADNTDVADAAALLASQVRAALAKDGDFNSNMAEASADNPEITSAAVTLGDVFNASCSVGEGPVGAADIPIPE